MADLKQRLIDELGADRLAQMLAEVLCAPELAELALQYYTEKELLDELGEE